MTRRAALVLVLSLAACAPAPPLAPPPPPPPRSAAPAPSPEVAAAPGWSDALETVVPDWEPANILQTRTHLVWEEVSDLSAPRVAVLVIALDKKTLQKRTVHSEEMRSSPRAGGERFVRDSTHRRLWTSDDDIFLERTNETLMLTSAITGPLRLPKAPENGAQCADAERLYQFEGPEMMVTPLRVQAKTTTTRIDVPAKGWIHHCVPTRDGVYVFIGATDPVQPSRFGRVRDGKLEALAITEDLQDEPVAASDARILFSASTAGSREPHGFFLHEPDRPLRLFLDVRFRQHRPAMNRSHVCWGSTGFADRAEVWCVPRDRDELPLKVADDAGPWYASPLLDDDYLWFVDGRAQPNRLVRVPVPREAASASEAPSSSGAALATAGTHRSPSSAGGSSPPSATSQSGDR